jgi:hypothetical protein
MLYQMCDSVVNPMVYLFDFSRKSEWKKINRFYDLPVNHYKSDLINEIKSNFTRIINGQINYNLSRVPVLIEDILIYIYYGLIEVIHDEVNELTSDGIITKKGTSFQTDIIFKCTGYEIDQSLLEGHTFDNTIFIDGKFNMTHNSAFERFRNKEFTMGPEADINLIPLVSYPIANHIFDEIAIYFLKYPSRFNAFQNYNLYSDIISNKIISDIEFGSYIHLFWKLVRYFRTNIVDIKLTFTLAKIIWSIRQDFKNNLSLEDFTKMDKESWNKISTFCHERAKEKRYLEYPF